MITPIGHVITDAEERYQLARQPGVLGEGSGRIELCQGMNYEQALRDIEGFERIWVLFIFDRVKTWKPLVHPPRSEVKRGLFSTRSPHRPNFIGLSCVSLREVRGRILYLGDHDLMNKTPVVDIKPYLPYADSFPHSRTGWVGELPVESLARLEWSEKASQQREWLLARDVDIAALSEAVLRLYPEPDKRRRTKLLTLHSDGSKECEYACKTWRIRYFLFPSEEKVQISSVETGYSGEFLEEKKESRWEDIPLHQEFIAFFYP